MNLKQRQGRKGSSKDERHRAGPGNVRGTACDPPEDSFAPRVRAPKHHFVRDASILKLIFWHPPAKQGC